MIIKKNTLKECAKKSNCLVYGHWSNCNNKNFYKNMQLEDFYQGAIQGGLDTGIDIKHIQKYIRHASSILEVGAGYGRVLSHILNLGYTGKLVAVERDQKFYQFLQSQFYLQADIFCDDIANFSPDEKFDLILWMWAGICEFSKAEQAQIISHLANMLNENGYLIFDMVPIECNSINAIELTPYNRIIETSYGKDYCYFPSDDEIMQYAQRAGLFCHENLIYYTNTNRKRRLSVFCFR